MMMIRRDKNQNNKSTQVWHTGRITISHKKSFCIFCITYATKTCFYKKKPSFLSFLFFRASSNYASIIADRERERRSEPGHKSFFVDLGKRRQCSLSLLLSTHVTCVATRQRAPYQRWFGGYRGREFTNYFLKMENMNKKKLNN